jgi:hypothetical protein
MKNKGAVAGALLFGKSYIFFLSIKYYYYFCLLVKKEIILPYNNFGLIGHEYPKTEFCKMAQHGQCRLRFLST